MKKLLILCLVSSMLSAEPEATATHNLHRFILANYHLYGNNVQQAGYWYDQLKKEKQHKNFYIGYLPYLEARGNVQEIISLAPELDKHFEKNIEIQSIIARALEKTGQVTAAQDRLIKLNNLDKSNQEIAFKVAQMYLDRQEPENALKVIDTLLNSSPRKPNNFIFYFLKSQIYLLLNKKDDAYTAIKTCIETYPKFDKGWLVYGMLEEQAGKIDQAINGYTSFLEMTNENHPEIEKHVIGLVIKQKASSSPVTPHMQHGINQALSAFEKREYRKALEKLNEHLHEHAHDLEANIAKINLLTAQKEYDKALSELIKLASETPDNALWLKSIHLLYHVGVPYKKLIAAFDTIAVKQPHQSSIPLYIADLYLREHQNQAALTPLKKALHHARDPLIKSSILYQIALIYYETHQTHSLRKIINLAAKEHNNYPPLLNFLAYYYATQGNNIPQAESWCTQALSRDPHNPHFLDTKALILYKQQRYQDALALLDPIVQSNPDDITVIRHLSKTLYKIGQHDRALKILGSARSIAMTRHERSKISSLISRWGKSQT